MFKKIFNWLKNNVVYIFSINRILELEELNNKLHGYEIMAEKCKFIFSKEEDEMAYMHLRRVMPYDFESIMYSEPLNKGVILLKFKNKFYVLTFKKLKEDIIEITSFKGIGKDSMKCPMEPDNLDNIFLSKGYATAAVLQVISLEEGMSDACIQIEFNKILEYQEYAMHTKTIYTMPFVANDGDMISKQKIKPVKYTY